LPAKKADNDTQNKLRLKTRQQDQRWPDDDAASDSEHSSQHSGPEADGNE